MTIDGDGQSGDDDAVVIEIDAAEISEPPASKAAPPPEGGTKPKAGAADNDNDAAAALREQVTKLTGDLDAEKRKGDSARSAAADAQARADAAARVAADTRRAAIEESTRGVASRKQSIETESEALVDKYAVALASNDYSEAAKIQRRMTALEVEKADLERTAPTPRTTEGRVVRDQEPAPAPPPRGNDLVEQWAAQLPPSAAAWIRAHPDYATDQNKNLRLKAHHNLAVADGFTANTPEYFAEIEKRLGMTTDGKGNGAEPPPAAARTAPPPPRPSAPGRGNGIDAGAGGKMRVTLTASERRTATDGTIVWPYGPKRGEPIGIEEYAKRKAKMAADGRFETPYV